MRTIQMTLDEDLVKQVDAITAELHTTRSAFTRAALKKAVENFNNDRLERKHQQGYSKYPVTKDEFTLWEEEQDWGDE